MAFGGLVDAVAFGALNEFLGIFKSDDGVSRKHFRCYDIR